MKSFLSFLSPPVEPLIKTDCLLWSLIISRRSKGLLSVLLCLEDHRVSLPGSPQDASSTKQPLINDECKGYKKRSSFFVCIILSSGWGFFCTAVRTKGCFLRLRNLLWVYFHRYFAIQSLHVERTNLATIAASQAASKPASQPVLAIGHQSSSTVC